MHNQAGIYLLQLTMETLERCHYRRSGVFIVNFEHISYLILVFLLLTLNMELPARIITIRIIITLKEVFRELTFKGTLMQI